MTTESPAAKPALQPRLWPAVAAMVVARASGLQPVLTIAVGSLLAWGYFTLIRLDGITGQLKGQQSWRWTETAEARFLKERQKATATTSATDHSPLTTHDSPL